MLFVLEFPFELTREKKAERTFAMRHRANPQVWLRGPSNKELRDLYGHYNRYLLIRGFDFMGSRGSVWKLDALGKWERCLGIGSHSRYQSSDSDRVIYR